MSTAQTRLGLLNSWKEIAAYLGRGVRTVQRWEKMGLPICRVGFGTRAPVLAYAREIDFWVQKTQLLRLAVPPVRKNLPVSSLRESIQQAHRLRSQMEMLLEGERKSREQLLATVIAMEKSCVTKSAVIPFPSDFRSQALDAIQPLNLLADKFENKGRSNSSGS